MTSNKWNRKYNQRQRKKMRVGEYQELVFVITANPAVALSAEQREAWMDDFVEHAIEGNGVVCAAAFNDDFWCYVMGDEKRSVTPTQRLAVLEWLSQKTEIINVQASPIRDAHLGIELDAAQTLLTIAQRHPEVLQELTGV